jgi:hypothetical protein
LANDVSLCHDSYAKLRHHSRSGTNGLDLLAIAWIVNSLRLVGLCGKSPVRVIFPQVFPGRREHCSEEIEL